MAYMSHVFAEVAADSLLAASHEWAAHPTYGTHWALPSIAMLVASLEAWTGERLAWANKTASLDIATRQQHERLIYEGPLTEKFAALWRLGEEDAPATRPKDDVLRVLMSLRHEIMHPLPAPQGIPPYMRVLARQQLLVVNAESQATAHLPIQLLASYPLAWWAWNVANERCLKLHERIGPLALTSNYQLPVGLPVPPECSPIRWHDGEGHLGDPPENRWAGRLPTP